MLSAQIYAMKSIKMENQLNEKQRFLFAHFYFHSSNTSHLLYFSYNFFVVFFSFYSLHNTVVVAAKIPLWNGTVHFLFISIEIHFSFFFFLMSNALYFPSLCLFFYVYYIESGAIFFKDDKEWWKENTIEWRESTWTTATTTKQSSKIEKNNVT